MEEVIPNETTGTAGTVINATANTTANTTVISAADTTINTTVSQGPSAPTIIFHTTSVSLMTSTTSASRLVQSSQGELMCENVFTYTADSCHFTLFYMYFQKHVTTCMQTLTCT